MNRFTSPVMTAKSGHSMFSISSGSAHLNLWAHESGEGQESSPPVTTWPTVHVSGNPSWISNCLSVGKDPKRKQLLHELMIARKVTRNNYLFKHFPSTPNDESLENRTPKGVHGPEIEPADV